MKFSRFLLSALGLLFMGLSLGCTSKTAQDTSMPWSRPASWEGQIPGMGSPDEGHRRDR
jgi:hypothetical protein